MNQSNANILDLAAQKLENKEPKQNPSQLQTESSRDKFLTDFGKATLIDRYLLPGEKFQDMFMRVAKCYSDNDSHAQRIYEYISKLWFMPATPILSNGGAKRGLPISCFLNTVHDSLDGILSTWGENCLLYTSPSPRD